MIKSRLKKWAGHVARIGEKRILMGKSGGRRPLRRSRRRWKVNIKINPGKIEWCDTDWVDLT
jgi:hypothetical protein